MVAMGIPTLSVVLIARALAIVAAVALLGLAVKVYLVRRHVRETARKYGIVCITRPNPRIHHIR